MKVRVIIFATSLLLCALSARAQSPITSMALGPDQIGTVKTAQGITTRISFPEAVQEIICGDLYDSSSGRGTFVLQRGGTDQKPGNDVFLKPVASKGRSNLFVKVGENGKHTFNFVLTVVSIEQAHLVVNVTLPAASTDAAAGSEAPPSSTEAAKIRADIEQQARQEADEILRNARQQANRITAEAQARVQEMEQQSLVRSAQAAEERFVKELMFGLRDFKISNPRTVAGKRVFALDPRGLTFDEKNYLRYTITNNDTTEFVFGSVSLENGGRDAQPVAAKVTQSKTENKLSPGESLAGVISFDAKLMTKDRLTFVVRAEDGSEIARITVQ